MTIKSRFTPIIAPLLLAFFASGQEAPPINIIPIPADVTPMAGQPFVLTSECSFHADGTQAQSIADFFAAQMKLSTGYNLERGKGKANIRLQLMPEHDMLSESYDLTVHEDGVLIVAKDAAGLFYGMQSLLQLFPAEIASKTEVKDVKWVAPAVKIADGPRFPYRGVMLDVCRHFMSVEFIKRQIDVLAMFKMNRLHWHLTEDQAWRIEIKKYPKLTEIGARRIEGEGHVHEGFYTQEEVKDIIAYAAARHITVIPEFELPGHELAAIAAYPELSCRGGQHKPRIIWGVEDIVMCPAKDSTFTFIEDVIGEMCELFPSEYFHIGGDECPKVSWKNCPACQQLIKEQGLQAEHGHTAEERLQSYVINRVEKMLNARGKKLLGWDEILEGGLSPNATVMSWRGEKGGITAARMGHDVVMSPTDFMYLDYFQGHRNVEPVGFGGYVPLSKTYSYDPIPAVLAQEGKGQHVLGVQGNLWSEYLYTEELAEYRLYPRALAIAEVGWSLPSKKNFDQFCHRLDSALMRLDAHSINYHIPQPEQQLNMKTHAFVDATELTFKSTRPVKMVYTLDGSDPTPQSTPYVEPLLFTEDAELKIRSVLPSGKMSPVRHITMDKQSYSAATKLINPALGLRLRLIPGKYLNMAQLHTSNAQPQHRLMKNWLDIRVGYDDHSTIAEGYVYIPEDGVYLFETNNNELWIDGKLLVNNDGEVKRHSRSAGSMALAKGHHHIKVVWLGNIIGGWPSQWDNGDVSITNMKTNKKQVIAPNELFHQP